MSNEELVLLYQQGNKKALESLIEANEGIVKSLQISLMALIKWLNLMI